jgi:excisionase family DNA binding protein
MDRAFTIQEFCRTYKLGRTKTWQLIKEHRLKAVSVGSKRLIRADDAEVWLASLNESGS